MNLTDSKALEIATKALNDVQYSMRNLVEPSVRFLEDGDNLLLRGIACWLVSFTLDKKVFGDYPPLKVFVSIQDSNGLAHHITQKRRFDFLGYDAAADKYFKKPKPEPK